MRGKAGEKKEFARGDSENGSATAVSVYRGHTRRTGTGGVMFFGSRSMPLGAAAVVAAGLLATAAEACDYSKEAKASLRFNINTDRLYLEGSGCITPSDIYKAKLSPAASASDPNNPDLREEEAEALPIKPVTKDGEAAVNETG